MDFLKQAIDFFLHLDKHLDYLIQSYGTLTYLILFAIIFCETGLVVTPVLPGDSLLFAVGALSARPDSPLNVVVCYLLLTGAALLGDNSNYWIGRFFGPGLWRHYRRRVRGHIHGWTYRHGRRDRNRRKRRQRRQHR